jgi:hypothetical protein
VPEVTLSRIVMRHSKRQTFDNGTRCWPCPWNRRDRVVAVGSGNEKQVYQSIEVRNRKMIFELKRVSMSTVAVSVAFSVAGIASSLSPFSLHLRRPRHIELSESWFASKF